MEGNGISESKYRGLMSNWSSAVSGLTVLLDIFHDSTKFLRAFRKVWNVSFIRVGKEREMKECRVDSAINVAANDLTQPSRSFHRLFVYNINITF